MILLVAACFLVLVPHQGSTLKLPNYMTACSVKDPELDQCVLKNARVAIPKIINGDPKYRVPNLNPMTISELALWQGTSSVGLKLAWKDAQIHGLKNAQFLDASTDTVKKHTILTLFLPRVTLTGTYTASGRILILPITGTGPSNVTADGLKVKFEYDFPLYKKPNGREYVDITNAKMTVLELGHMKVRFDNLFNGDRLLGENMNTFINENWQEVSKEFVPGVVEAIGEVFKLVLKNICDLVPYDTMFDLK